ncbi:MAG: Hsp20/alpha crystallin family protein [Pseudomonadota bacterium]|nr:Hsp20/alpha crystallin family protein [Pseudomonadota bacterium]
MDDLFKGFLVRPVTYEGRTSGDALPRMKVDVSEKNGAYLVKAELKREKQEQDERVLHEERVYGKLQRTFTLPQEVDESKAQAKFNDGVLELTLPKKQAAKSKQISIQ